MRDWRLEGLENFGLFQPLLTEGRLGIPVIAPVYELPDLEWTGFNYARKQTKEAPDRGVHFFLDDYQFTTVWKQPQRYLDILRRFGAVMSPDFSTYRDMPMILQIYNHYRKHWCAQYWQSNGINVIPTISWSTPESFEWCFDGEPHGSVVAISTVGVQRNREAAELFRLGYAEMMERLAPCKIICYGRMLPFMGGKVVEVAAFYDKFDAP